MAAISSTASRSGATGRDPVFVREDGAPWGQSHQVRCMREACEAAKITPPVGFHILRHMYATLLLRKGVPIRFVPEALGNSVKDRRASLRARHSERSEGRHPEPLAAIRRAPRGAPRHRGGSLPAVAPRAGTRERSPHDSTPTCHRGSPPDRQRGRRQVRPLGPEPESLGARRGVLLSGRPRA
ncbi:MAG: phage integrase family protein [Gammaproteobacteria bacterium]|nr:phage integrase family protein [Gammaproteobacteria bacterium]NIR84568.1 phage integrase family protein [Gammaproteobacteria bacterium]NIR90471.1 phage integrase family protein [Gammaproteobacteria bacterium]NIU05619.1 phage integrase family protein [Gammaproteobacteria bacterium]NIV52758.1 tyrosine-type recombinase/integrase [Gammaproteobacteria bacterium]